MMYQGRKPRSVAASLLFTLGVLAATMSRAADVDPRVLEAQQQRIEAIARCIEPTISVFDGAAKGGGSGVVITPDGYALTNFHVTSPSGDYMKCSMPDGRLYDAVIVGSDPTGDVALIKLLGRDDFPCAELGDSDQVRVGDWCVVVGNPFLLATDFQPTVSFGIISGVHRYQYPAGTLLEYADCLQTDAAINPGNSGGPLFNAQGQLIGINGRGSFEKRGRVNVGVGYAISINQIKNFMGYLRSGRIVDHATLGASVTTDQDGRVVVSNILTNSDAYRRGLRFGDEIVAFGGRPIDTVNAFKNTLGIFPKGWRIPLSYRRNGERFDVPVRLTGVHSHDELIAKAQKQDAHPPIPQPKEEEQPDGDDPNQDKPPRPRPKVIPQPNAKKSYPPHVQKLIKPRTGYANYYFNELNRQRVWDALVAHGSFTDVQGTWTLKGEIAQGGGRFDVTMDGAAASGTFPTGFASVDMKQDLDQQLGPPGSGGMLAALMLWRRLLTLGPTHFGEVYYLGTVPVPGRESRCDVLVGTHGVVETWFICDPTSGLPAKIEMFADPDLDPC